MRRDLEQRRLAGTVVPHQRDALPRGNLQRNSPQRHAHPEALLDIGKADPQSGIGGDASGVDTRGSSALDQIAQHLFCATALPGILLFRDRTRLAAQFDAQQRVLQ